MMKRQGRLYRVVTFLKREELEFLNEVANDLYFTYGVKAPRARLIEEIVAAGKERGVVGKNELIARMLNKMGARIERRKYPRLKKNLLVGLRKMDSLQQYKNGLSENISMGGLKVELPSLNEPLSVNQVVELTIKGPQEQLEPIKAIGRVAWMKEKEDRHGFELGIMLTYIRKEDRERFTKYLNEEKDIKNPLKGRQMK